MTAAGDDAKPKGRLLRAHEVTWSLWAVLRSADEAEHVMAGELGLSHTDASALEHVLTSVEPMGPTELARRLGIRTASVTVLIDRLVEGGYVVRRPDPRDGRRRVLEATELARQATVSALAPFLRLMDAAAEELDPPAAEAVVGYLRRIAEIQRDYIESATGSPAESAAESEAGSAADSVDPAP